MNRTHKANALVAAGLLALAWIGNADAVEFRRDKIGDIGVTVAQLDLRRDRLQLFLNDERGQPIETLSKLAALTQRRGQKLVFAMNAGMYHPDHMPVGLFVSPGAPAYPLNQNEGKGNFFLKPNGVFMLDALGARVVDTAQYAKLAPHALLATQSGPLLLQGARVHPGFDPASRSRLVRNGVCSPSSNRVIFAISEGPVTFYEFAVFFRDRLGCKDALYLDGVVSSLYAPAVGRSDSTHMLGPMFGVTETAP